VKAPGLIPPPPPPPSTTAAHRPSTPHLKLPPRSSSTFTRSPKRIRAGPATESQKRRPRHFLFPLAMLPSKHLAAPDAAMSSTRIPYDRPRFPFPLGDLREPSRSTRPALPSSPFSRTASFLRLSEPPRACRSNRPISPRIARLPLSPPHASQPCPSTGAWGPTPKTAYTAGPQRKGGPLMHYEKQQKPCAKTYPRIPQPPMLTHILTPPRSSAPTNLRQDPRPTSPWPSSHHQRHPQFLPHPTTTLAPWRFSNSAALLGPPVWTETPNRRLLDLLVAQAPRQLFRRPTPLNGEKLIKIRRAPRSSRSPPPPPRLGLLPVARQCPSSAGGICIPLIPARSRSSLISVPGGLPPKT